MTVLESGAKGLAARVAVLRPDDSEWSGTPAYTFGRAEFQLMRAAV